jgi:hypothetical protein
MREDGLSCGTNVLQTGIISGIIEVGQRESNNKGGKLLLATDNEGRTVWQVVAWCSKVNSLQKMWNRSKEKIKIEEAYKKFFP